MFQEGYDVFTVNHPAVAVELKVARPIAYPLARTLIVASGYDIFHSEAIENIRNSYLIIPLS